jgi:hypothetical protein
MGKPTEYEVQVAMALFEELLENFSPVDQDDVDHAEAGRKVIRWIRSNAPEIPDKVLR